MIITEASVQTLEASLSQTVLLLFTIQYKHEYEVLIRKDIPL